MKAHPSLWRIVPLLGLIWALPARSEPPSISAPPVATPLGSQAGHAPGLHGGQGLIEVGSALLGRPGTLRVGLLGEHGWGADLPRAGVTHRRTAGTFSASYVPLKWLELSASWAAASHVSGALPGGPVQAIGDATLAAKVTGALHPRLMGGVELMGQLFPGIGSGTDTGAGVALGFAPRLLLSADLDDLLADRLPLRAHLNVGGRFDTTAQLVRHALDPAEELALGIHRFPRVTTGFGVELPFPMVAPFAEHALALPIGVGTEGDGSARHTLAAGLRVTAIRDLTLTLAGRLGLDRARTTGVPSTLPFNVFLGAAFHLDALAASTPVVPAVAVAPRPPEPVRSRLRGVVLDEETQAPLAGAVITVLGSQLPPVATSHGDGAFLTHEVEGERVTLSITRDGYLPLQIELPAETGVTHTLHLAPRPLPTYLAVTVRAGGQPVAARLSLQGNDEQAITLPASSVVEHVPVAAGTHTLLVEAEGHLAQTRVVQLSEGGTLEVDFDLAPIPAKPVVVFRQDRIEILQQVRFAAGRAQLHPDSLVILRQVVDAVVRNRVPRMRVEGHTDSSGSAQVNLRLSRERAQAVADALVSLGLDRGRLEVAGFGSERPIAPNVNARGRELNRRVEFLVLESKE